VGRDACLPRRSEELRARASGSAPKIHHIGEESQLYARGLIGLLILVAIVLFLVKVAVAGGIIGLIALILLILLLLGRL
jgi:hypothetical protein